MKYLYELRTIFLTIILCTLCIGCSPEVGSEKWCAQMDETPKGDWTANNAADYAKHCLFKMNDEQK